MLGRYISTLQPAGIHRSSFSGSFGLSPKHKIISPQCSFSFNFILLYGFYFVYFVFFFFLTIHLFWFYHYNFLHLFLLIRFIPRLFHLTICFIYYFNLFSQLNLQELQYCSWIMVLIISHSFYIDLNKNPSSEFNFFKTANHITKCIKPGNWVS